MGLLDQAVRRAVGRWPLGMAAVRAPRVRQLLRARQADGPHADVPWRRVRVPADLRRAPQGGPGAGTGFVGRSAEQGGLVPLDAFRGPAVGTRREGRWPPPWRGRAE